MSATDTRVFGRLAPAKVAADIMSAGPMHLTPAPPQPADLIENPLLPGYYNALDAIYEILDKEIDKLRLLKLQEFRVFLESVIALYEKPDTAPQQPVMPAPPPGGAMNAGPPPSGQGTPGMPGPPTPPVPATTAPPMA